MSITVSELLSGPSAYIANTPWRPMAALAAIALILVFSLLVVPLALYFLLPEIFVKMTVGSESTRVDWLSYSPPLDLLSEVTAIGLVYLASGMRGGNRIDVLALRGPANGIGEMWIIVSLIWLTTFPVSFVIKEAFGGFQLVGLAPTHLNELWLQSYIPIMTLISFVVAGPLLEELIFRGFFLSALAGSRLGFWRVALVTNVLWVSMHFSYPWHAFPMIFVVGLALSFAVWKTGSLWTSIVGHGLYNLEPALVQFIFARS
jgi:membrane protease YdiL (CAAX protease family)